MNTRDWARKSSNFVLAGMVVFFALVSFYALYRSRVYLSGEMKPWYFVSVTGIVFFAFALTRSVEVKIKLALITASLVFTVYLAESVIYFFLWGKIIHPTWYGTYDKNGRTKPQVLESLREQGREAFPSIIPYSFVKSEGLRTKNGRIFPLGGISERTTVFCNESGEFIIFESDEHGFNNPRDLYKVGEVDIVLTGDSFAQSACVEPGKGIAGQLRKTWKGVLTVGSSHNGPLLELATLKEYAEPLHPRIVLWLYYEGNDLQNLLGAQTSPLLMKYLRAEFSQNLLDRQTEIDEILVDYVGKEAKKIKTVMGPLMSTVGSIARLYHLRRTVQSIVHALAPAPPPPLPLFREIVSKANNRVSAWGGRLYFVYLRATPNQAGGMGLSHRGAIFNMVSELGIPIIDVQEVLDAHPDPISLIPLRGKGIHYTPEGYRLLAEQIRTVLEEGAAANRNCCLPGHSGVQMR